MSWQLYAVLAFVLWSFYLVFMNEAIALHGEAPTMMFEALGVLCVAIYLARGSAHEFQLVSIQSVAYAVPMALCTAGGLLAIMKALALAPGQQPTIVAVSGLYPMGNLLVILVIVVCGGVALFPHAELPTGRQLLGIAVLGVGYVITFWPNVREFFVRM